jgi:hypothetical protein
VQFVERYSEIAALTDSVPQENCATWSTFQTTNSIVQDDSGI